MNLLDSAFIIIVAYCITQGILRGVIKGWFSIIGVCAGFFWANMCYLRMLRVFLNGMSDVPHLRILSFLAIFFGVYLFFTSMGIIANYFFTSIFPKRINRFVGAGFGAINGMLIVAVLLMNFTAFFLKNDPEIKGSFIAPYALPVSGRMAQIASKDIKQKFDAKVGEYKKAWGFHP